MQLVTAGTLYTKRTWLQLMNQLLLSLYLTAICLFASSDLMVFSLYKIDISKESFLKSILCSTGRTPNRQYTATFAVLFGRHYSLCRTLLCKVSSCIVSLFLNLDISRPYSNQGRAKVSNMWYETNGFIPELP